MSEDLDKLLEKASRAVNDAADVVALDAVRVGYLGKKGELTAQLKSLGRLPAEPASVTLHCADARLICPGPGRGNLAAAPRDDDRRAVLQCPPSRTGHPAAACPNR